MNAPYASVDYLKALCMLYIVGFWHLFNYTDFFPQYYNNATLLITNTTLGLFCLISGYLIAQSCSQSHSLKRFYLKRFLRIYPLYALAVFIFYVQDIISTNQALKALALFAMIDGPAPKTLWFINMIVLFYIVSPLLFQSSKNIFKFLAISIIAVLPIIAIFILGKLYQLEINTDVRFFTYYPCFCLGMYFYSRAHKNVVNLELYPSLICTGACFGVLFSGVINPNNWKVYQLLIVFYTLASAHLIFILSHQANHLLYRFKGIVTLSYVSYAMYLFHRPLFNAATQLYYPENPLYQFLFLLFICLPIIGIFSFVIQKLADKYCKMNFAKKPHFQAN